MRNCVVIFMPVVYVHLSILPLKNNHAKFGQNGPGILRDRLLTHRQSGIYEEEARKTNSAPAYCRARAQLCCMRNCVVMFILGIVHLPRKLERARQVRRCSPVCRCSPVGRWCTAFPWPQWLESAPAARPQKDGVSRDAHIM